MTLEQYAYLSEIIGVILIIASLVYLAKQVRQNHRLLEIQSYQAWVDANLQININLADPVQSELIAQGNFDSRNLSDKSFVAFAMINMAIMQMAQSTHYLYRSGTLDRELWEAEMNRVAGILSFPGVRQWWDAGGRTQLTPSFVEHLESMRSNIEWWNWDQGRGFFRGEQYLAPGESHN